MIIFIRSCLLLRGTRKRLAFTPVFLNLNNIDWGKVIKNICVFLSENIDSILNISILLSCIFIYINIKKVLVLIFINKERSEEKLVKWSIFLKKIYWFIFLTLWTFIIYFDYVCSNNYIFFSDFILYKRTIKLCLAFILNTMSIYINYNTYGLKSWRTFLSMFSMTVTIILVFLYFNDKYNVYYKEVVHGIVALILSIICLYSRLLEDSSLNLFSTEMGLTDVKEYYQDNNIKSKFGPNLMINSEPEDNIFEGDKASINSGESKSNESSEIEFDNSWDRRTIVDMVETKWEEIDDGEIEKWKREVEKTWIDGLDAYLARWETGMEGEKSELKEDKISLEKKDKEVKLVSSEEISKLLRGKNLSKEELLSKDELISNVESHNLKSILKHSKFMIQEKTLNVTDVNDEITDSNQLSKITKLEKKMEDIINTNDDSSIQNVKKEPLIRKKKTLSSIRSVFNIFNKGKTELDQNILLKSDSKESKSFLNKIKPKFLRLGSKKIDPELLAIMDSKEEENKKVENKEVKLVSSKINIVNDDFSLKGEYKEEWIRKEYLMSLLNPNMEERLEENLNDIKIKKIRSKWRRFLELSNSKVLPNSTKEWMIIESIRPKYYNYNSLTDFDFLILPSENLRPVLTPEGKIKLVEKKGLFMNSLKIEGLNLIEKYPMGVKEIVKGSVKELPPISMIDYSFFEKMWPDLYKNELSSSFREESQLLFKDGSKEVLKLKNGLSKMLLGQNFKDKNYRKYEFKKELESLSKLLDVRIPLKEPWSDILIKDKCIEESIRGTIINTDYNKEEFSSRNVIDITLPYFSRLVPSSPEEYLKIYSEIKDYKEKAEQIIKWNEWAIYQIMETYKWNKDILTRNFVWYNKDYLPFYGPMLKNINWDDILKNELDSLNEICYAKEILLNKKLPLSWEVMKNENEFWDKEYNLFKKDQKMKMLELGNKLYEHLANLYNNEKKEWFRVYDLSRRIMNNNYNWEWADKYNEIEEHFLKNNGYSYRERIWAFDRYLTLLDQNWMNIEKGKSIEFKKRIEELELKWNKSFNSIEKLKQDVKLLSLDKPEDVKENIIKKENLILDSSKKNNEKSIISKEKIIENKISKEEEDRKLSDILNLKKNTEDLKSILSNRLELKGKAKPELNFDTLLSHEVNKSLVNLDNTNTKNLNVFDTNMKRKKGNVKWDFSNMDEDQKLKLFASGILSNSDIDRMFTSNILSQEKGKGLEKDILYKDDDKVSELKSDESLDIEKYIDKDQLFNWVQSSKDKSDQSGWSITSNDQIIAESSKDAEIRAQKYLNFLREEKLREKSINKSINLETNLINSDLYDPEIIASRKNKPLTIVSNELRKTWLSKLDIKVESELNKEIISEVNNKDKEAIISIEEEKKIDKNKNKLMNIRLEEEKKSKIEMERALLRKKRKTHLSEILSRGKEVPIYKYRGDDRFLDSDSEESVHEEKPNLYQNGYYLDPETGKMTNKPKIIHDSYGSTLFSPALPDPVIKTKTQNRTFLAPGHEWAFSSSIPSDFDLLSNPLYVTNSRYGPYGSERFIRNLIYNKEIPKFIDTDYRDGFTSVWKNNDVTQCTYALLDQRIPKMLQEDIYKQDFDISISRARYLDNDQEWDITKKIEKKDEITESEKIIQEIEYKENKDFDENINDNSEEFSSPRWFKERTGEPRETVFIREGNTYLAAHRNIEVNRKALEYLSQAVIDMFGKAHGKIVRPDVNMWAAWTNAVNSRQIATRTQVLEFLKGRDWDRMNFIQALQFGTLDVYIRAEKFGEINLEVSRDDQHEISRGSRNARDYVIRITTIKLVREEEMWLWKYNLKRLEKIGMPDEIESLKDKIASLERQHERVKYGLIRNKFIRERNLFLSEELGKNNKPYSW